MNNSTNYLSWIFTLQRSFHLVIWFLWKALFFTTNQHSLWISAILTSVRRYLTSGDQWDLNSHAFRHRNHNPGRLPISPWSPFFFALYSLRKPTLGFEPRTYWLQISRSAVGAMSASRDIFNSNNPVGLHYNYFRLGTIAIKYSRSWCCNFESKFWDNLRCALPWNPSTLTALCDY